MNEAKRAALLDLIMRVSFERKKVILASGRESDFYLDLRKTLMRPLGVALAGELLLERINKGTGVDSVGGMAVGAVPLVSGVLAAAHRLDPSTSLLGFFVRKDPKKHGLGQQIEGAFVPGQRVALLEDTTTTGGSTLDAARIVREAGGIVTRVLCIVDRGEGASAAFQAEGLTLESLFSRSDLPL
ncbi:MAG TPA: orotate phosphoribosyltransferase [Planctomycetota bacterium]|jgi:orotate phosphoribosyltransferase|nr:orotate phosphoribosyltransferase [Planctomycetota bacterium]